MRFRLTPVVCGLFAVAVLAAPAAHAFTFENKGSAEDFAVPKFDVEEQAKNFRKDGTASNGKTSYDTPVGKFEFGAGQSNFGTFGSGFGPGVRNNRADFDRIVTPENLR